MMVELSKQLNTRTKTEQAGEFLPAGAAGDLDQSTISALQTFSGDSGFPINYTKYHSGLFASVEEAAVSEDFNPS